MWLLAWLACAPPPPTPEAASGLPPGWIALTDPAAGFEVAFPRPPLQHERQESVQIAGAPVFSSRWELVDRGVAFVLYRTPEPPGAVARNGGPAAVARKVAQELAGATGARLLDERGWDALPAGYAATLALPSGAAGEVRVGLDGDVLYVLQVTGATAEVAARFVGSFRRVDGPAAVRVALPGGSAECPARCAPLSERLLVGRETVDVAGIVGQIGLDRFDAWVVPVPEGAVATAAAEAVHRRLLVGAVIASEVERDGVTTIRYQSGQGAGELRIADQGDRVVALRVLAPTSPVLPAWAEPFLGSWR